MLSGFWGVQIYLLSLDYNLPMSLALMSLSWSSVIFFSTSLVTTSWGRRPNCFNGCSNDHCWWSTALQRVRIRAAITGHPLRSEISNNPRMILPAFCQERREEKSNLLWSSFTSLRLGFLIFSFVLSLSLVVQNLSWHLGTWHNLNTPWRSESATWHNLNTPWHSESAADLAYRQKF